MNEIQAAEERLRAFKAAIAAGKPDTSAGVVIVDWLWTVAEAYLASHPPDDAEPVTEEWLRSVGVADVDINAAWDKKLMEFEDGICGKWSRIDVRRLCSALGIELREGA